jgi:8-oxo-dGTP pyrophosphatase MutT (NUDIX family)
MSQQHSHFALSRTEFLRRFQLTPLSSSQHQFRFISNNGQQLKQAAVLIPIIDHQNDLTVLFTRRASTLKHHGGQISFPGGKVEPQDTNLLDTALREAQEEINLPAEQVCVVGQLNNYQTISGFSVTPIIGLLPANLTFTADHNEVEEIFEVPLSYFLDQANHHSVEIMRHQQIYRMNFMPFQEYPIWGATAAMLKDLVAHLLD